MTLGGSVTGRDLKHRQAVGPEERRETIGTKPGLYICTPFIVGSNTSGFFAGHGALPVTLAIVCLPLHPPLTSQCSRRPTLEAGCRPASAQLPCFVPLTGETALSVTVPC